MAVVKTYKPDKFSKIDKICRSPKNTLLLNPASFTTIVIVGGQKGDEGKGSWSNRITQIWHNLKVGESVIARIGGASNAGHSFRPKGMKEDVVNRMLPCGTANSVTSVVGRSVLVRPDIVITEIAKLKELGFKPKEILVDEAAFFAWDAHVERDKAEEIRRDAKAIGTTQSGVGPAGADYWGRTGLTIGVLKLAGENNGKLQELVFQEVDRQNALLAASGSSKSFNSTDVFHQFQKWGEILRPHIVNTYSLVREAYLNGHFVGEGAQAFALGRQTGFSGAVTSTDCGSWPLEAGYNVPREKAQILGVIKLVPTAVGNHVIYASPSQADQEKLYARTELRGAPESGRVSGRKRKYYTLSIPELIAAKDTYGITAWLISKADVCDGLSSIPLGLEYVRPDGFATKDYDPKAEWMSCPNTGMNVLEMPGWNQSTAGLQNFEDLPEELRAVVETIAHLTGIPVAAVGTGPNFEDRIFAKGFPS